MGQWTFVGARILKSLLREMNQLSKLSRSTTPLTSDFFIPSEFLPHLYFTQPNSPRSTTKKKLIATSCEQLFPNPYKIHIHQHCHVYSVYNSKLLSYLNSPYKNKKTLGKFFFFLHP